MSFRKKCSKIEKKKKKDMTDDLKDRPTDQQIDT